MAPATAPLPLVVAGPILRRVEPTLVCVWIATSFDPVGLEMAVLDVSTPYRHEGLGGTSSCVTIRVGTGLYISLISGRPRDKKTFPAGKLLAYELWYMHSSGGGSEKRDLLAETGALAYGNIGKPSFRLGNPEALVLLHGSCRKPDGQGHDALASADTLIGRAPRDARGRPELLILTGDQVYANSVPAPLLAAVQAVAGRVSGYDEYVPTRSGARPLGGLQDRGGLAREAGFNANRGHLFGVTEIISLYLLSWSKALWPAKADATRAYEEFVEGLPAVQRALANVPVYMIFDDHEVTDDWNLHSDWVENVRGSPLGRRVVSNALVAYWLCQAWGNDPARFDARFIERVRSYLAALIAGNGQINAAHARDIEDLAWDFHGWGYVIPSRPPIFVLDTRTERELAARGEPPALLNDEARRRLEREVRSSGLRRREPFLVVAPTPVFGMLFAEAIERTNSRTDGPEAGDFEHWRYDAQAHHQFLRWIMEQLAPSYTVFFSGDVHYSYTAEVDYLLDPRPLDAATRNRPDPRDLSAAGRFYQFTSSPMKNETKDTVRGRWQVARWAVDYKFDVAMWDRWDISGIDALSTPFDSIDWRLNSPSANYVYATFSADLVKRHPERAHRLVWREVGNYHRYRGDWAAPYYPYANLAEVTITANGITHTLVVRTGKSAALEPGVAHYVYATKP